MNEKLKNAKTISIIDEGQIKEMSLPDGFVQQFMEPSEWHHSRYVKNFHRTDNPNVRLVFYFRGNPLSQDEGETFNRLLTNPTHSLSAEELQSLETMLYEDCQPKDFKIVKASTEQLNEKAVLRFEGLWVGPKLYDSGVFIHANPKTHLVQEIHFLSPEKDYEAFKHYFDEALRTILWR